MSGRGSRPVIVWLRRELRLADHEALHAAARSGAPLLPLYIHDEETPGALRLGGASRWWLQESLKALQSDLAARGDTLVLRKGATVSVLGALIAETNASAVHATQSFEPFGTRCEEAAAALCRDKAVAFRLHPGRLLFAPGDILTKDGKPFRVFTPFWKACRAAHPPTAPLDVPRFAGFAGATSMSVHELGLLRGSPGWTRGLRQTWTPGESRARDRLARFAGERLGAYADRRDALDGDTSSRLSPHLHFGEIGPNTVWHVIAHAAEQTRGGSRRGAETFLKELGWRDFSYHLLHRFPELPDTPLRPEFARFPWRRDDDALRAWRRGRTGYPVVDAAMRQLWRTGWMPNRARMIVASFLVKHLLAPWQDGAAWFWDTLVDADLANNAANWQWVAGCGTDAAPYFRIFNPVLQAKTFDPGGDYVRTWVLEIARLPSPDIHAPWQTAAAVLTEAGIGLGDTYPRPIVDHGAARARALAAFEAVKRGGRSGAV